MTTPQPAKPPRKPAVAGTFYPDDPSTLQSMVRSFLDEGRARLQAIGWNRSDSWPKALIAPHAGYIYSGPIAGTAYATLLPGRSVIQRVILIGPSHRLDFPGLAVSSAPAFLTPLGQVPLDQELIHQLIRQGLAIDLDRAHAYEHSLEVHLPFLIETLERFQLLPIAYGRTTPQQIQQLLDYLWNGRETLLVVSSDLSHYEDYHTAQTLDRQTAQAIEALAPDRIASHQACGALAIQGLLAAAASHQLQPYTLDLRNSGDTAGPRHQVVGYGAFAFTTT